MLFNKFFQSVGQVSLAGVLLSIGLTTSSLTPTLASNSTIATTSAEPMAAVKRSQLNPVAASNKNLSNGIYLYGQSALPEQIGQEYLVFETREGKTVGAFYMPSSEFSCFYGTIKEGKMDLIVVDPYDRSTHSYAVALESNPLVASSEQVALQGYQPITQISENDHRLLNVCRADHQQEVWEQ